MPVALGIDVGVGKGLDVVLLDEALKPLAMRRRVDVETLGELIDDVGPDVIAIDSPPSWGETGGCRQTESDLRRLGINSYGTPSDLEKAGRSFYDWMRVGFKAFEAAATKGFPRYAQGSVLHTAAEVFPYASSVVLAGSLRPPGTSKRAWRTEVLQKAGVTCEELRSLDQIDAALAALTGLLALQGRFSAPGDPAEGVIVLPTVSLPTSRYRSCPCGRSASASSPTSQEAA